VNGPCGPCLHRGFVTTAGGENHGYDTPVSTGRATCGNGYIVQECGGAPGGGARCTLLDGLGKENALPGVLSVEKEGCERRHRVKGLSALGAPGLLLAGQHYTQATQKVTFVKGNLRPEDERRKPDGIVFLPLGGIKAVVEVKVPSEVTEKKLPQIVEHYSPIAAAVCNLLIITDGKKSYWINPHTLKSALDHDGKPVRDLFSPALIDGNKLNPEKQAELVQRIEEADRSLSPENDQFSEILVTDPMPLARSVWQKIWINTGKDPEKCLYNVVEILVFKFLSDAGVLTGNVSFRTIVKLLNDEAAESALNHYARISRPHIRTLFPVGEDRTTIINGTIFVNETGQPNSAQAILFGEVIRAFQAFDDQHGSLRNIDRQFKTRLYESFLRQEAAVRSLGQYFTPRNVVQAVVEMSDVDKLKAGMSLCDPFCGVGGFLLEAIVANRNLWDQFEPVDGKIRPQITIRGYDKGTDEKDDERTIILAKANMLVYLSDLLVQYPSPAYLNEFARNAFNAVFRLIRSNLGTFQRWEPDDFYDLIFTNPPYVTSGSASLKTAIQAGDLSKHYSAGGRGTEGLAVQWVVQHLKPDGEAFMIVPDGLLNQASMLSYVKRECFIRGIVALPSRTFYSTPKKTYILAIRKKAAPGLIQNDPVFAYLVSEIGESRDTRRVPIQENDLSMMAAQFRYFTSNPLRYSSTDPRCKLIPWADFDLLHNWLVDRSWTPSERINLGIEEASYEVDPDEFRVLVAEARDALNDLLGELG
jgi:type I restriction enzyme M protein